MNFTELENELNQCKKYYDNSYINNEFNMIDLSYNDNINRELISNYNSLQKNNGNKKYTNLYINNHLYEKVSRLKTHLKKSKYTKKN